MMTDKKATAPESEFIVEVEKLVISYGNYTAIKGVSFQIKRGEFLTLLGPSGCGKSTLLRAIAGLEKPSSGVIKIDGKIVYSSEQGINLPPEHRDLSMVFQSYAIWPHLSTFENAVYGLRVRKKPKAEIEKQGKWALDLVRMGQFADRRASALSGGQQQRVAIARAVAFAPKVILFDEPLSNLDANLRVQMRSEIKELQRKLGVTSIYVTHDQEEALTMSDRIIVLSGGDIQQESSPEELYNLPTNSFVAKFIGSANMFEGEVDDTAQHGGFVEFVTKQGTRVRATDNRKSSAPSAALLTLRSVFPQLRKGAVDQAQVNAWDCEVREAVFSGDFIEYSLVAPWGEVIVRRPPTDRFAIGDRIAMQIDPTHCVIVNS